MVKKIRLVPFDLAKAEAGAKVVTRGGDLVQRIEVSDVKGDKFPVRAVIQSSLSSYEGILVNYHEDGLYTSNGFPHPYDLCLCIEEEVEEDETDSDYDPYKATVESIMEMARKYSDDDLQDLEDFFDNVKVKCREALEYEKTYVKKQGKQEHVIEKQNRLMTCQELSDWLRDCPEEHREYKYAGSEVVNYYFSYVENYTDTLVRDVLVRSNHGEWHKPLVY